MTKSAKGFLSGQGALWLTAFIWGTAFAAQSLGAQHLGCFTINGVRSLLGALTIFLCVRLLNRKRGGTPSREEYKTLAKGGVLCGILLFGAANLQQAAISQVDSNGELANIGKVSFLTAVYLVLVPVLGAFAGRKTGWLTWLSVLISLFGAYLLTVRGSMGGFSLSDALALGCAVLFSLQILLVDRLAPNVDCLRLSMLQFITCGVLSMLCAFVFEHPSPEALWQARGPVLYAGILSSGIAYTLQMVGQKNCPPQVASLIMSLESVFGALSGYVVLGQALSLTELCGCALMLGAVLLTVLGPQRAPKG